MLENSNGDNGSSYVSGDLAEWLKGKGMKYSRGAPDHDPHGVWLPQLAGAIEGPVFSKT